MTRLDFSSTVDVTSPWPPISTQNSSSLTNANGSTMLKAPTVARSLPARDRDRRRARHADDGVDAGADRGCARGRAR